MLVDYPISCYRYLAEEDTEDTFSVQVNPGVHYSGETVKLLEKVIAEQEEGGERGLKSLDRHWDSCIHPNLSSQNTNAQKQHKNYAWLCVSIWKF